MSYPLIDKKTEKVRFGFWPFQERIKTTLKLVSLGNDYFDIHYYSQFNGIKTGKIKDIEIPINGNVTTQINGNPEIIMNTTNYSQTKNHIAIRVKIDVEIPILGNRTIYNQTLEGYHILSKDPDPNINFMSIGNVINSVKKLSWYK